MNRTHLTTYTDEVTSRRMSATLTRLFSRPRPVVAALLLLLLVSIPSYLFISVPGHRPLPFRTAESRSKLAQTQLCPPVAPAPHQEERKGIARALSPLELMCRPLNLDRSTVPKLFHQSWKTRELPERFQKWSLSCREKHPDWEWVLWSDDDNLTLVRTYFPELEAVYHNFPHNVERADFARNLYMSMFGG